MYFASPGHQVHVTNRRVVILRKYLKMAEILNQLKTCPQKCCLPVSQPAEKTLREMTSLTKYQT